MNDSGIVPVWRGASSLSVIDHPVDRVVKIRGAAAVLRPPEKGEGTTIWRLSEASRRAMAFTARNYGAGMTHILTLTYPGVRWAVPEDGRAVKGHLNAFLCMLRRRFPGLRYFWFLEFQERKAPHFHMFMELNGAINLHKYRDLFARAWVRITWSDYDPDPDSPDGDESYEEAIQDHYEACCNFESVREPHAVATYAAKESDKMEQKEVPISYQSVGRFWGVSRTFRMTKPEEKSGDFDSSSFSALCSTFIELHEERVEAWKKCGIDYKTDGQIPVRGMIIPGGGREQFGPMTTASVGPKNIQLTMDDCM